ncbi:hypothetical protein [Streptomyces sp. NPDC001480]
MAGSSIQTLAAAAPSAHTDAVWKNVYELVGTRKAVTRPMTR